ncbi:MAG: hypothetical protein ACE15D_03545 [Candidatus Eisenbacteria bacterium]
MRSKAILTLCGLVTVAGAASLLGLLSGCSTRESNPALGPDSTFVYAGKQAGDVSASIVFSDRNKTSKRTGKHLGARTAFDIEEGAKVYAFAELQDQFARGKDRELIFHMVWLDPDDETAFKKTIRYMPSDSVTSLMSTFTATPGKRQPGFYTFRVYLFRELIAEKQFELRGEAIQMEKKGDGGEM